MTLSIFTVKPAQARNFTCFLPRGQRNTNSFMIHAESAVHIPTRQIQFAGYGERCAACETRIEAFKAGEGETGKLTSVTSRGLLPVSASDNK